MRVSPTCAVTELYLTGDHPALLATVLSRGDLLSWIGDE
jgi:hypothetical protein